VAGVITLMSSGAFFLLFKPPRDLISKAILHPKTITWLSVRERLMAVGLMLSGLRLMSNSLFHLGTPLVYDGRIDEWTAVLTAVLIATASVVSLGVYLRYRIWEPKSDR
jgi:multisubunit Na+/H+ antiporter MnhB subunit